MEEHEKRDAAVVPAGGEPCSVTLRSICIGAALIPITCMWLVQSEILWYSSQPTTISLMPHVMFMLFFLTVGNAAVRRWRPGAALNPGELLTVYVMLTIGSVVCGHDSIEILVPMIPYAYRGATPENGWEKFHPYLPQFVLLNAPDIVGGYYEGGSTMYTWRVVLAWARPMLWWASFIFVLIAALFLINSLLRKQWTENEKLSYPVIQIPLLVTTQTRGLFSTRLLWYGFAIAAAIDFLNGLNHLVPAVPRIPVVHIDRLNNYFTERPWNAIGWMPISLYPFAIGVCFFLPLDMAFSCWFFFVFFQAQRVLGSAFGVAVPGFPFVEDQTAGGYLALCLIALWVSRRYLKDLALHLVGLRPQDDSREALPYRTAALLLLGCLAYLGLFLHWLGMSVLVIVAFLVLYLAIAVAIARMRAELGPPAHDLHYAGPDQMLPRFLGMKPLGALGPYTLTALSLTWFFNRAYRGHAIAPSLEGFKIAQETRTSARRMLIAMLVALAIGIFGGLWAMLHVGYKYGMEASAVGPGWWFGFEPYSRNLHPWIASPREGSWWAPRATGVGVGFALLLALLRMRFAWWPFHPVGYAVSGSWSMSQLWFPIFVSWLIKWVILHYGGAKAYRRAVPFFIGLALGEFVVGCLWDIHGILAGVDPYSYWPY
ncbi:MAG: hypothetical protein FJ291_01330 [Planctomycetes bacterium]|nr:hypothetical protein [Planctomycetota bacterium]